MVGLIIPPFVPALAALATLAASPSALTAGGPTCDPTGLNQDGDSCEAARPAVARRVLPANPDDEPRYATQAVIDCPVPAGPLLPGLVGECDAPLTDASYRASRDADSERTPSSLRPARRDRSIAGTLAACARNPSEGGDATNAPAPSQPLALFALPALPPVSTARFSPERATSPPTRSSRPLERPPRAWSAGTVAG